MKLSLAVLAATLGLVAADDLKIDVTHAVECERKTQKGDSIEVHYHGTFADSGEKFDSSMEYISRFSRSYSSCLLLRRQLAWS